MVLKSHYICKCGSLLYQDLETKKDFCLNKKCNNFIGGPIRNNSAPIEKEIAEKRIKFLFEIRKFSRNFLLDFLCSWREELIKNYFFMQGLDMKRFFSINELIRIINKNHFRGRSISKEKILDIVKRFSKFHEEQNFLDEVLNKKYIILGKKPFVLKYAKSFLDLFTNYGITDGTKIKDKKIFKYAYIDFKNDFEKKFKRGDDLIIYYKRFYRLMVSINYFLNYYYKQSLHYNYEHNERDIAFLLSFWFSSNGPILRLKSYNFKKHLMLNSDDKQLHKDFLQKLIKTEKVPVIVEITNYYFIGRFTLLFFTFYLIGLHSKELIREGKEVAASVFEDTIRKKLRGIGYNVPFDKEFKLYKKSYGYDVIAISEHKKEILLIEAKYKDLPSSSLNGITLLEQELHSKNGLISMTNKQKDRLSFFKNNLNKFAKALNIKDIDSYTLKPFIITKYKPLIFQKDEILIYEIDEFLQNLKK